MLKVIAFIMTVAVGLAIAAVIHAILPAHPTFSKALGVAVGIMLYEPIKRLLGGHWENGKKA